MWIDITNNIKMFLIGPFPNGSLGGLTLNIFIAFITTVIGFVVGLFLALCRISKNKNFSRTATILIEAIRALPLLLIVFWFYFIIPILTGKILPLLLSACIAISLYSAVNQAEIFRAGFKIVSKEQWQTAFLAGLSYYQTMRYIILPQVIRIMLPSFASFFISIFKDTSIVYIVGLVDLTQIGIILSQREPNKIIFSYMFMAFLYFIICFFLSRLAKRLEKRQAKWSIKY